MNKSCITLKWTLFASTSSRSRERGQNCMFHGLSFVEEGIFCDLEGEGVHIETKKNFVSFDLNLF
jgi:hypothetical protein